MNRIHVAVMLIALLLAGLPAAAQANGTPANQGVGNAAAAPVVRILAPGAGARLAQPAVAVRYELTNPGVSPSPTFRLQLDGRDPVTTATTDYTFNDVAPGKHVLTVELVDANSTPVAGSRSEITFTTLPPGAAPAGGMLSRLRRPDQRLVRAALEQSVEQEQAAATPAIATARGALPLLSVIGFGVLLGGIASAMKTR